MSEQDKVAQFQAITGLPDNDCRRHLQSTSWNLDLALDRYFNSNAAPPDVFHQPTTPIAPLVVAPPPVIAPIAPPPPGKALVDDFICGLFAKKGKTESVPLRGLAIKAHVVDMVSEVEVSQRYFNDADVAIEAVFKFKQEECSIFGFEAIIDGHRVVGEVKEKEEALNTYDDAISTGGHGFLLSQDTKIKGAFNMSVGNLPPGKECIIKFRYVSELSNEGHNVRLSFPITQLLLDEKSSSSSATTTSTEGEVKDGLQVEIDVEMPSAIPSVECTSGHEIDSTINGEKARITFDSSKHVSGTGLVLLIGQQKAGEPQAVIEVDHEAGSAVAMVSFIAELEQLRDSDVIAEVVFVVDRSGSMAGSRMNQAKNALALFLHSLPIGTRFNVVGFGTSYSKLFPTSVVYDDSTLATANNHARDLQANMGGTELMGPLRAVLSTPMDPLYPRQVFVLTDGEVDNTSEVIEYVRKNAKGTRLFTLGIGSDASPDLVNGIARAGQGQSEFVISGERMEAKVLRQLKRALQPVLKQPKIKFGDGASLVKAQAPEALPAVFDGERIISYAFFNTTDTAEIEKALSEAEFRATTDMEDDPELRLKVLGDDKARIKEGKLIHRLAARIRIKELEESAGGADVHKDAITELALRYGLVSTFTSFVATADGDQAIEGTMRQVQVNDALLTRRASGSLPQMIPEELDGIADQMENVAELGNALSMPVGAAQLKSAAKRKGGFGGGGMLSSIKNAVSSVFTSSAAPAPAPAKDSAKRGKKNKIKQEERERASDMDSSKLLFESIAPARSRHSAVISSESESDGSWDEDCEGNSLEGEKMEEEKSRSSLFGDDDYFDATPYASQAAKEDVSMDFLGGLAGEPLLPAPAPAPIQAQALPPPPPAAHAQQIPILPTSVSLSRSPRSSASAAAPARPTQMAGRGAAPGSSLAFSTPVSAPISGKEAAHMRPLDRFVHYQKANGSWQLDDNLAQAVGRPLSALTASVPAGVSAEVWATALALAALEANFADQKEEWELLAGKAKRWLSREWTKIAKSGAAQQSLEEFLAAAATFIAAK